MNIPWRMTLGAVILVVFLFVGIAHVINPDYFIKRSGVRKGGELLTESNRIQFQLVGAIFAGFAGYLLYLAFRSYISN